MTRPMIDYDRFSLVAIYTDRDFADRYAAQRGDGHSVVTLNRFTHVVLKERDDHRST